jgi:hypothetical protein
MVKLEDKADELIKIFEDYNYLSYKDVLGNAKIDALKCIDQIIEVLNDLIMISPGNNLNLRLEKKVQESIREIVKNK